MYLERLQLANFKNYTEADVSFSDKVNCFVGNNGVGKTNLLDAIYYLSFCKSYFNTIDAQNICHGEDFFAIHGQYKFDDQVLVSCTYRRGQTKQIKFNKKNCSAFSEHIGRIPLVIVSPNDQTLILGGSEMRRKFIDGVISQVDHTYLQSLIRYQKAVEQRNRLLKQFYENKNFEEDSIALWDEQLVHYGSIIYTKRQYFLKEFTPLFQEYFTQIADIPSETPNIHYNSQLSSIESSRDYNTISLDSEENILEKDSSSTPNLVDNTLRDRFYQLLREAQRRDAFMQFTTVGIHKDDIDLLIADYPVKKYGSQGQQKTFLLALKLAQFDYINRHLAIKPILLLDDIFDKLDLPRVKQLIHLVGSNRFGQVFITDTQQGRVENIFFETPNVAHKIFQVSPNSVIKCE